MLYFFKFIIIPFAVIAILCIGTVEVFYFLVERNLAGFQQNNNYSQAGTVVSKDGSRDRKAQTVIDSSVIIRRNLFSSDIPGGLLRENNPLAGLENSSLDVVLMGTITGVNAREKAIIYDNIEKKQELYETGDYIQQAVIKRILRGKVILDVGGRDEMLDIKDARNVPVAGIINSNVPALVKKILVRELEETPGGKDSKIPPQSGPSLQPGTVSIKQVSKLKSFRGGVIVDDHSIVD